MKNSPYVFYLDPNYKNFIPGASELKFSTLSEIGFFGTVMLSLLALLLLSLSIVPLV